MNNNSVFEKAKKLFQKGLNNLQDENYDDAEKKLLECLKLAPNRISTLQNLIALYISTEQKNKLKNILNSHNHLINEHELQYGFAFDLYFDQNQILPMLSLYVFDMYQILIIMVNHFYISTFYLVLILILLLKPMNLLTLK